MSGAPQASIAAARQPPPAARTAETIFDVGANCCAVARAHRVAFLVDGEDYFQAFVDAAERAERSILVLAWDFDSQTSLCCDDGNTCTRRMGDFLNALVRRRKRLHVNVLDWDYPMLYAADREFPPIYGLGWKPHRRVHFRFDDTHPVAGSHHQKIVVDRRRARLRAAASTSPAGAGTRREHTSRRSRAACATASPTRRSTT